ncbi:hypothetical protein CLV56_1433 [Mumia flava]|uniref:Permease n=1 Tax=Mumia flava TaxID=1348852 RepID=A0A2M9BH03_9ACTN|nr:hypothetical protein [Mumia flava]PJJ57209.1 hypothetical protein CLV56_1433 [Mumia flava]
MSSTPEVPNGEEPVPSGRLERVQASGSRVVRALILIAITVVLVVALAYALAAFVPRSWAQWVGNRVDGSLLSGTVWGLFLGFAFTLVPLALIWLATKRWVRGGWTVAVVLLAVLLAAPNLMTLSVVLGTNSSAHAGERILDVDAPGFRAGSLWGALLAVAASVAVVWLTRSRRSRGRRIRDLESEAGHRGEAESGASPGEAGGDQLPGDEGGTRRTTGDGTAGAVRPPSTPPTTPPEAR